jgi:transcriptional regulator with XRE-family HTH domain
MMPTPLSLFMDSRWPLVGMTNDEAAAYFGVNSPHMISMWRMGRTPIAIAHLPKLAALLNVDIGLLFNLWLKQQRVRDPSMPLELLEVLERRLVSAHEAVLIAEVRNAVKNTDPAFSASTLAAIAKAVTP